MTDSKICVFDKNEEEYIRWLAAHPDGYVLNATRAVAANYLVLHKATCPTIIEYKEGAQPGGFTEREYIKICADDLQEIEVWLRQRHLPQSLIKRDCFCWKDDWL